jgi:hypothetical protein
VTAYGAEQIAYHDMNVSEPCAQSTIASQACIEVVWRTEGRTRRCTGRVVQELCRDSLTLRASHPSQPLSSGLRGQ